MYLEQVRSRTRILLRHFDTLPRKRHAVTRPFETMPVLGRNLRLTAGRTLLMCRAAGGVVVRNAGCLLGVSNNRGYSAVNSLPFCPPRLRSEKLAWPSCFKNFETRAILSGSGMPRAGTSVLTSPLTGGRGGRRGSRVDHAIGQWGIVTRDPNGIRTGLRLSGAFLPSLRVSFLRGQVIVGVAVSRRSGPPHPNTPVPRKLGRAGLGGGRSGSRGSRIARG
ncbi:hypothetical protein VTI74DRAFT_9979 [Chaetomium olivicolor]